MEEAKTNNSGKYFNYTISILLVGILFYFVFTRLRANLPPQQYTIEYEVTGTCEKADVTYTNYEGGMEQISKVSVPWKKGYTVAIKESGNIILTISAQNQNEHGSVSTSIKINGKTIKSSTSEGSYVVASASAMHYFEKD